MQIIHAVRQMRRFDYSFLLRGSVSFEVAYDVAGLCFQIGRYGSEASSLRKEHQKDFEKLKPSARIDSVRSSNALEGIETDEERLVSIVNGDVRPSNPEEQAIAGYRDALDYIRDNRDSLDISEKTVLELHSILMSYTGEEGGHYRDSDSLGDGSEYLGCMPVPASETAASMDQLMLAYRDALSDSRVCNLLLIPCFVLDFLCIHPFPDGNGRLSRLLTLLLMDRDGIEFWRYASFEARIDADREGYGRAVRESSDGWQDGMNDYVPFIANFLRTVCLCCRDLSSAFATVDGKRASKTNRIEAVVLGEDAPITKREICRRLPDVSVSTVESVLAKMVKDGRIELTGRGRDAAYRRAEDY